MSFCAPWFDCFHFQGGGIVSKVKVEYCLSGFAVELRDVAQPTLIGSKPLDLLEVDLMLGAKRDLLAEIWLRSGSAALTRTSTASRSRFRSFGCLVAVSR
jgi:hypothetical protein